VSHTPLRKEKDCLNCGTVVQGRYCHECGQENVVPKETFWHMVTHFFNDITHFDGSFFVTAKDLLFKPGFLSKEYMAGRRVKYLHPVRMYVFTSAFFFLLFFSFFTGSGNISLSGTGIRNGEERLILIAKKEKEYGNDPDKKELLEKLQLLKDTTKPMSSDESRMLVNDLPVVNLTGDGNRYRSTEEYDSIQKNLPASEKDGWFLQRIVRKEISINNKYQGDPSALSKKLSNLFLHRLPYMLFVSLPLFALILRLVYIRRKQFYFADHGVFTIHLYVFTFILLLLVFLLEKLQGVTNLDFIGFFIAALFILQLIYLFRAMRVFYGQGKAKTFVKFIFVSFASLIMMLLLTAIFFFYSTFSL
jgi:hypothetical protein